MSTTLSFVQDQRGFTVQTSTTHQTQAGAVAHLIKLLAQLHHQHPATAATEAATLASTADLAPPAATAEASCPAQQPINPFARPRPAHRGRGNDREEPPF